MTQSDLLRADLERETAVRAGDEDLILRAANAALARVTVTVTRRPSGIRPSSRRRRQVATALVAAALISASGLAAALWTGALPLPFKAIFTGDSPKGPPARVPGPARPTAAPRPEAEAAPAPLPSVVDVPENVFRPSPRVTRLAAGPSASVAELFRGANASRRGGDVGRARRLYSELIEKYPNSDEARLAQVSLGKLLLAEGKSKEAEREFSHYLAGGQGQLAEEALVSQAQSLERLKRGPEEQSAWQRLLAEHPESVYAAKARARLKVLSPGVKSGP